MSPIYVRPEREQAEHDRLIRFLQAKYKKYEVVANPGDERNASIKVAATTHFPDLVLNSDRKLAGVVEIETAASVNNLETMAKWVPFSRARVPFHLYVPVQGYETALRLAEAHQVKAAEIWTYRSATTGFDLVRMFVDSSAAGRAAKSAAARQAAGKTGGSKAAAARAAASKTAADQAERSKSAASTKATPRKSSRPAGRTAKSASRTPAKSKPAAKTARPTTRSKPRTSAGRTTAAPRRRAAAKPAARAAKKGSGARTRR